LSRPSCRGDGRRLVSSRRLFGPFQTSLVERIPKGHLFQFYHARDEVGKGLCIYAIASGIS
jgi:hypothetical protein